MYSRPTPCVVATPLSVKVLSSSDAHGNTADAPPAEAGAATATPVPIGAAESKDVRAVIVDARFRSHLLWGGQTQGGPLTVPCAQLGGIACEEESKAVPQRRAAASGRLLTFAYEYASHQEWKRLQSCDASEAAIRSAFERIGFHTSLNAPIDPAGMKKMLKSASEALNSGDVLAVYYFGHGRANARTQVQYLETEQGPVCTRCLHNIVIEAVVEKDVSDVTFLLILDCCRIEDATSDCATHRNDRDGSVIVDATRLGITVSNSTCPGT